MTNNKPIDNKQADPIMKKVFIKPPKIKNQMPVIKKKRGR